MGLLKKAVNEQAYLKMGVLGLPGSGKTFTMAMVAIAIAQKYGKGKPVAAVLSEPGLDFLIPRFEAEGIELLTVKTQSFKDLMTAAREAEGACSFLLVDSITHFWRELVDSYMKKKNTRFMTFKDWGAVKGIWAEWTNFFLNSKLHLGICGRAGYDYEETTNEEGKKEITKVGTKMKVESEFGFEPSFLVEMERADRSAKPGSGWIHRAHILKDRSDTINGMHFDFQKIRKSYKKGDWRQVYKAFAPALDSLNIGGSHMAVDTERNSQDLFNSNGDSSFAAKQKQRDVALAELQGILTFIWPGQDATSKKCKGVVLLSLFNVHSWEAVEQQPVETLEEAVKLATMLKDDMAEGLTFEKPEEIGGFIRGYRKRIAERDELPASFAPAAA